MCFRGEFVSFGKELMEADANVLIVIDGPGAQPEVFPILSYVSRSAKPNGAWPTSSRTASWRSCFGAR